MSNPTASTHTTDSANTLVPGLSGQAGLLTGREPEVSGLRQLVSPPLIVHVDHHRISRHLVAIILGYNGYHYRGFGEGDSALDFCLETPPRLVIAEVNNTSLGGPEMCRQVYDAHGDAVCLMMLTACDRWHYPLPWIDGLDVEWCLKPFPVPYLVATVEKLIGAGVPRPPDAPSISESRHLMDTFSDDVYPPFLSPPACIRNS
jgi:response regulator RpfG family c-di-GMP phosphodiesterase